MTQKQILVVDDEQDIRRLLCISLERMGHSTVPAENCKEASLIIENGQFDLALTDIMLPDGNGMSLISKFKSKNPNAPIAVMTAFDTTDIAVEAMKKGAFDFLPKPIRQERLRSLIDDALSDDLPSEFNNEASLITGNAPAIIELRRMISKVAQTQAPVFITGESGTGKELVARSIHQQSHRHDKPFIAVNCGAIPGELMESEFFGHKKGSFTGANADKDGLFHAADGGTLFLDEVADLPLAMQVKLLRAIQEKAVRPVGAQDESAINVRILSATHKDLFSEISKGDFRQDLYYRLNVIDLNVPPLRTRKEDIHTLSISILASLEANHISIEEDALSLLDSYDFPGNVRELENLLHRALAMCEGKKISVRDISLPIANVLDSKTVTAKVSESLHVTDLETHMASVEKKILEDVLEEENWNKSKSAERLGLSQRQFRYKLTKHGLSES